jgi:hypothetical protein
MQIIKIGENENKMSYHSIEVNYKLNQNLMWKTVMSYNTVDYLYANLLALLVNCSRLGI